jgi:hypothetical protein
MIPKDFKQQMLSCQRIYFTDPEGAINASHMFMAQVLIDLGYEEGVTIYKDMINDLMAKRKIIV